MSDLCELHNRIAPEIVKSIIKPPLEAGGNVTDILILTETVLAGVILKIGGPGMDDVILNELTKNVRQRMADIRLRNLPTSGEA